MVIEITKRYIISDNTLDTIVKDYSELYNNEDCSNFREFLSEEMGIFCEDEIIVKGDINPVRKMCELQLYLNKLKEKILS